MKITKGSVIISICIFLLAYCVHIAESTEEVSLSRILSKSIMALTYLNFKDDTFLVTVTSKNLNKEDKSSKKKLAVYIKHDNWFKQIFDFDAGLDNFVGMFPFSDDSNSLMTIWTGGSGYHFRVITVNNRKVSLSLEMGSHNFPELADIDNDGKEEILISEGSFMIDRETKKVLQHPETTNIYKQEGDIFRLIRTVPWGTRLK